MAAGGNSKGKYKREFYYHIEGEQLALARADKDPVWKDVLPLYSEDSEVYHTVKCSQNTTFKIERCIGRKDAACMKKRLKEFIKKETEKLQGSSSIRLEARFGRLFFICQQDLSMNASVTIHSLEHNGSIKKQFTTGVHTANTVEALTKEKCDIDGGAILDAVTVKVRFEAFKDERKLTGICYIEEKEGRFTLLSTHGGRPHHYGANTFRIDMSRPGMIYDIRLATSTYEHEDNVPDPVLIDVAKEITRSMKRSTPDEIRMQLVGYNNYCNWHVCYIRENRKRDYKWKTLSRWTLSECNIREFNLTKENRNILKRDQQFCDIPVTYHSNHTEIELLWSQPNDYEKWITDESPGGDNFDEFVGACFDIARKLEEHTP